MPFTQKKSAKKEEPKKEPKKEKEERCKSAETMKKVKVAVKINKTIVQNAKVLATISLGPIECVKDKKKKSGEDEEDGDDAPVPKDDNDDDENEEVGANEYEDKEGNKCKKVRVVTKVQIPVKVNETIWQELLVPAKIQLEKIKCAQEK